MAKTVSEQNYFGVNYDERKAHVILNDAAELTVTLTGTLLSVPVLSASTAQVTALDPAHRFVLADATAANFGIVLPAASAYQGVSICVKKIDVSANTVFLSGAGSDKIENAATLALNSVNESATVMSDGQGWRIVAFYSGNLGV